MAVVAVKAAQITNLDTIPIAFAPANLEQGNLKCAVGTAEGANGDSIASTYRLVRLASNVIPQRVLLSNDAIATSGAADVGVWQTAANGGLVVDADFFASAVVLTGAQVNVDITHEADAADAGVGFGLADVEKFLWQGIQLTADPGRDYDIALQLTTALGGAGTFSLRVFYTTNQ